MNEELILKLREILYQEFSETELLNLAKDLGLDPAQLVGEGHFGRSRAVVTELAERGNLLALRNRLRDLRPSAFAAAGLDKFSDSAVSTAKVGRSLPMSWIVGGLAAILILVVLCGLVLFPPNRNTVVQPASDGTPAATAAATSDASAATSIAPTSAPAQPTQPPQPTNTALPPTPTLAPTEAAPPTSTPTLSETHPAALRIPELNVQLIDYYQGKIKDTDLRYWRGAALSGVVNFSKVTLPRILGITEADRGKIVTNLKYVKRPRVIAQSGNTFTVDSQEYWDYSGGKNKICETRNYRYVLVKDGQTFAITAVTGTLVNNKCQ